MSSIFHMAFGIRKKTRMLECTALFSSQRRQNQRLQRHHFSNNSNNLCHNSSSNSKAMKSFNSAVLTPCHYPLSVGFFSRSRRNESICTDTIYVLVILMIYFSSIIFLSPVRDLWSLSARPLVRPYVCPVFLCQIVKNLKGRDWEIIMLFPLWMNNTFFYYQYSSSDHNISVFPVPLFVVLLNFGSGFRI